MNDQDSLQSNKSSTVISIQSNSDITHFKEMIDRRDFDSVNRLDINGIYIIYTLPYSIECEYD